MPKGAIFDLDGTLADTLADLTDAVNTGLRAFGFSDRSESDIQGWIGEGLPTLCRRAIGDAPNVPIDELTAIVTEHYRAHRLDKTRPYPGIEAMLDALGGRNVPLAILSNKPHEHTVPIANALFGRWLFVAVEGYREEDRRKPDPRTALAIVAAMELEPAEVLFVGDSATDVRTALNAAAIPVAVTWGFRSRQALAEAGAAHLIDHPRDLLALF